MNTLEPDENIDRAAYLATRLPTHEMRLDRTIAAGRVTVEGEAQGVLTPGDAMQIEVLFDGEVQSLKATGRAIISADVELGLIVFHEADAVTAGIDVQEVGPKPAMLGSTLLKAAAGKPRRFAALGKVEIRRNA